MTLAYALLRQAFIKPCEAFPTIVAYFEKTPCDLFRAASYLKWSWNFVLWGMMHGVALAAHKFWMTLTGRKKGTESHGIHRFFGVLVTFHFVCFCWIFFRNAEFSTSMDMLKQIFTTFRPQLFPQLVEGYWEVFALMALGYLLHFVPDSWERACTKTVIRLPLLGKAVLMLAVIYLVIQMKSSEIQPFIYFQF